MFICHISIIVSHPIPTCLSSLTLTAQRGQGIGKRPAHLPRKLALFLTNCLLQQIKRTNFDIFPQGTKKTNMKQTTPCFTLSVNSIRLPHKHKTLLGLPKIYTSKVFNKGPRIQKLVYIIMFPGNVNVPRGRTLKFRF